MPQRLSTFLKNTYGEKVYRLSLTSGCTCPNRDGSIKRPDGTVISGGCTFCSEGGSGEFAAGIAPVSEQIEEAKALISKKTDAKQFIAYFQSYTNTYGDVNRLREMYTEAISRDDIVALSIGTRPDCLGDDVIEMLTDLRKIKPVWIELGLQTINEKTAEAFNRGYSLSVFDEAYKKLKAIDVSVIVHVIFGLPGESTEDMLGTIEYLADLNPALDGIKIQNLQILKNTRMYREYLESPFHIFGLEEYTELVKKALMILPKDTVIHRMTGDGPRKQLVAPLWSLDKKRVLNYMNKELSGLLE